ncbi:hypothetical protein P170DRAFT_514546 [Aspergillus steynii IBT 23096]|uniref:Uncharacterized protein n=1 Tax=Aspergillus steynii IBT 23096 TaxID=1392250 RepID=A0A2I2FRP9_9EURO|nr:uncharacterized protein P170DRAFT_514546 [Aspergillus steynii IBT 23096]PLB43289.1 hypothetical protein P170DRAFT_514546 [Aspergillus steynii IBT 23096]
MKGSRQQVREHIMAQTPRVIFESLHDLPSDGAARILVDTPNSVLNPQDYLESIHPFALTVQHSLHGYRSHHETRFVAVNIYPGKHSYFVVDLNNVNYNYDTAHECKTPIPVYVLRLSKAPRIRRAAALDIQLAEMLAKMHNGHGQDPLPLFEDHNDPNLQYRKPRSLRS